MVILILAIAATYGAAKAIHTVKESWLPVIAFLAIAWVLGAMVVFVLNASGILGNIQLNYSTWGLLIGSGVLFLIYSGKAKRKG